MALKGAATGVKAAYAGFVELVGANRRCNCPSKPINVVDLTQYAILPKVGSV